MARKPTAKQEFLAFNVHYEDGSITSNRRIPAGEVNSLDGDAQALAFFEAQDREIGERSGRPRAKIKSLEKLNGR